MPPKSFSDNDDSRREKILKIIEREFDLELLLKYRELRVLEHELERGNELKELLEKLILNEQIYADRSSGRLSAPPQINFTTSQSADIFLNSAEEESLSSTHRIRGGGLSRSSTPAIIPHKPVSAAQQYQYDVRPDGTVLRMRCPSCGAEKFRSMLGFLNHCRLNCKLVFMNQEERLQRCGFPVPFEEIPPEYQNLSHSLMQKSLELAQICVDVAPTKIVHDSKPEIREDFSESVDFTKFGLSSDLGNASELTPTQSNRHLNTSTSSTSNSNMSRYYIKKQIIIGNVSRCLLNSGEVDTSVSGKPATHFFKLFIREADFRKKRGFNTTENDVLRHVKFVRFILHPAYKPNDVIDVYERPFTIEKPAWGEFPVRIQLHFLDERNKPVDLVHLLSIFSSTSSRYDQGVERIHELEIDKNTDFSLSSNFIQKPSIEEDVLDSDSDDSIEEANDQSITLNQTSEIEKEAEIDPNSLKYCRYCGIPHMPQFSFEIIQKNCAHKPRKVRLNSRTLPNSIFSNCVAAKQDVESVLQQPSSNNLVNSSEEDNMYDAVVDSSSSDEVKMVAAAVSVLGLPKFLPKENVSYTIAAALKCFLKGLLKISIDKIPTPESRTALDQQLPASLSPLHVFQAVCGDVSSDPDSKDKNLDQTNVYDFLSNAYFSASLANSKLPQ